MKRMFLVSLVVVLALVAAPTWAQEELDAGTICCREIATGAVASWVVPVGMCPAGWERVSLDLCPGLVVPTPVPTPADFVPQDVVVPSFWAYLIEKVLANVGKAIAIPAAAATLLMWLIQILKMWLPKLKGRNAYWVTVAITSFSTLLVVAHDLVISPGEWATVLVAVAAMLLAPWGYNLVWKRMRT